ncbi:Acylphosphatase-2 [Hondaea fermentalgiana]|uniref:acylphosphatase n=1 Tax=Hondaea fermentalgiana TaxID=2315210 RepID=A0A2R5GKH1_9STRA|nr:Acylphosphatase-2 [Hondaea fermentalgiana]|eukprot:GBG28781.1 Acylphosphatase-2 [Hondaea fermentalgiana]
MFEVRRLGTSRTAATAAVSSEEDKQKKKRKRKLSKRERRARLALTYGRGAGKLVPRTFLAALVVFFLYVLVLGVMERDPAAALRGAGGTAGGPALAEDVEGDDQGLDAMKSVERMIEVDFEVFGTVQKVSMRKYTQRRAKELGVGGSIENSEASTVRGTLRGKESKVRAMQEWLRTTGSPKARIERAAFSTDRDLGDGEVGSFSIKKIILANGKQWA